MPASPSIDVTKFPLSGDVTQAINPWKRKDDTAYRTIVDKLRKDLLSETATARLTYSSGAKR